MALSFWDKPWITLKIQRMMAKRDKYLTKYRGETRKQTGLGLGSYILPRVHNTLDMAQDIKYKS